MLHYSQTELLLEFNERFLRRFNTAYPVSARYWTYIHSQSQALIEQKLEVDYAFIKEMNKILSVISEIARKPHISVRDEDIIIRSALISEFQNEKFQKTVRQSELWRKKNGSKVPEYSYGSEYLDNYAVYENIVVKMCFQKIVMVVHTFTHYYQKYISDLGLSFSFDNYTFASFFLTNTNKLIDQKIFDVHSEVKNILESLLLIERKIEQIKKTHFYQALSKVNDLQDKIVLTNILKFDHRYNKVFLFYNQLMRTLDYANREEATLNYYTSVILKVIHRKFNLAHQDLVVTKTSFKLNYTSRRFLLDVVRKKNIFIFKVKAATRKSIMSTSALTIVNSLEDYVPVDEVDAYEYVIVEDEVYRYINGEFVILKYNYSKGDFELINTLLTSLLVTINLRKGKIVDTCPICGYSNLAAKYSDEVICLSCGTEHAVLNEGEKNSFVWIKKVNVESTDGTKA